MALPPLPDCFDRSWEKLADKEIQKRRIAFLLGAGTSFSNDMPTWKSLAKRMAGEKADIVEESGLAFEAKFELFKKWHNSDALWSEHLRSHLYQGFRKQAEAAKLKPEHFSRRTMKTDEKIRQRVYDLFRRKNPALVNLVQACSIEVGKNFVENPRIGAVLTTNVESLIQLCDRACHCSRILRTHERSDVAAHAHKIPLYQLHGYLTPWKARDGEAADRLVFTESEYLERNDNPHFWANIVLHWALREFIVIFVGCSMTDPLIRRALHRTRLERIRDLTAKRKTQAEIDNEALRHFATCERRTNGLDRIVEDSWSGLGVSPLWVRDLSEELPAGTEWLRDLLRAQPRKGGSATDRIS
jgi:hypothetical protein